MCHRIVVFSINVLKDERIVVVAEQRPECTEEQVQLRLSAVSSECNEGLK